MEDNEQDYLMENSRIAIEDADSEEDGSRGSLSGVVRHVTDKYGTARRYRRTEEERWLRSWRNYRGIYNSNVKFTDAEKSRVFIKVTKTKVLAAYNQIVDVLFGNQRFPLSIDPTVLPDGVEEVVHFDPKDVDSVKQEAGGAENTESPYGFAGDGKDLPPGATTQSLQLGSLEEQLSEAPNLKKGAGQTAS